MPEARVRVGYRIRYQFGPDTSWMRIGNVSENKPFKIISDTFPIRIGPKSDTLSPVDSHLIAAPSPPNFLRLLSRRSDAYKKGESRMWDVGGDAFETLTGVGLLEVADLSIDEPELQAISFGDVDAGVIDLEFGCSGTS